jgi:phosphatidylglycerol---prolipoprotein diacylglyceryl transferase
MPTLDPILVHLGPLPIYWYGVCYAIGLVAVYFVITHEAVRKGLDAELVTNGMIVIAVAALIGGRAYHVIDQWSNLYAQDPIKVILPPYTGLGVYGGLITGTLAAAWYIRRHGQPFWAWADVVAPGLFAMQAAGRWGNFFNQELYGPPTGLPWGIPIQCQHRIPAYACPAGSDPTATLGQTFQPLFLYESLSGLLGLLVLLYLGRRFAGRFRTGDFLGIFFVWYGIVRFALETLRADNWTFFAIPTAWLFSAASIAAGVAILVLRHAGAAPSMAGEDAARLAAGHGSGEVPTGEAAIDEPGDKDDAAGAETARPGPGSDRLERRPDGVGQSGAG